MDLPGATISSETVAFMKIRIPSNNRVGKNLESNLASRKLYYTWDIINSMHSEVVKIVNNTIIGDWHHSDKCTQLLVICHGHNDSNENPTIIAIADGLNKKGHDTFTFNFSENIGGFDVEHQVEDISHVVNHFKEYEEIILVAASFSALPAAIAAYKVKNISGLITANGFFGQGALGAHHRKTYKKFRVVATVVPKYKKILKYYKSNLKPSKISIPVLVIHTKLDQYVHIKQSRDFYDKLVCPKQFFELQHANHGITDKVDRRKVVSAIDSWLLGTWSK